MKSRLPIVRYVSDSEKPIEERIVDEVMKVWDSFPSDKFHAIFEEVVSDELAHWFMPDGSPAATWWRSCKRRIPWHVALLVT